MGASYFQILTLSCLYSLFSCSFWYVFFSYFTPPSHPSPHPHPLFPAQVKAESNKTAVSGKKASLSCSYGLPEKVQQIIWKHTSAQGESKEVASFAKRSDPMIEPSYQGRVWLATSLSNSQLTIQPVAIQDEGCYTCQYETQAEGLKSSVVCLSTYGKYLFSVGKNKRNTWNTHHQALIFIYTFL